MIFYQFLLQILGSITLYAAHSDLKNEIEINLFTHKKYKLEFFYEDKNIPLMDIRNIDKEIILELIEKVGKTKVFEYSLFRTTISNKKEVSIKYSYSDNIKYLEIPFYNIGSHYFIWEINIDKKINKDKLRYLEHESCHKQEKNGKGTIELKNKQVDIQNGSPNGNENKLENQNLKSTDFKKTIDHVPGKQENKETIKELKTEKLNPLTIESSKKHCNSKGIVDYIKGYVVTPIIKISTEDTQEKSGNLIISVENNKKIIFKEKLNTKIKNTEQIASVKTTKKEIEPIINIESLVEQKSLPKLQKDETIINNTEKNQSIKASRIKKCDAKFTSFNKINNDTCEIKISIIKDKSGKNDTLKCRKENTGIEDLSFSNQNQTLLIQKDEVPCLKEREKNKDELYSNHITSTLEVKESIDKTLTKECEAESISKDDHKPLNKEPYLSTGCNSKSMKINSGDKNREESNENLQENYKANSKKIVYKKIYNKKGKCCGIRRRCIIQNDKSNKQEINKIPVTSQYQVSSHKIEVFNTWMNAMGRYTFFMFVCMIWYFILDHFNY